MTRSSRLTRLPLVCVLSAALVVAGCASRRPPAGPEERLPPSTVDRSIPTIEPPSSRSSFERIAGTTLLVILGLAAAGGLAYLNYVLISDAID